MPIGGVLPDCEPPPHTMMSQGVFKHPAVTVAVYFVVFALTIYIIQKFDDLGSGWSASKEELDATGPGCHISEDPAGNLLVSSPICKETDMKEYRPTWQHTPSGPNEPSFCSPKEPWFWFDLGGTMCVCDKRWDYDAYWAKTFTSFAFNFPHFMTPFQIYLVYQRWMWVFIYLLFNEVFEEFMLALTGFWGFTFDPPYDVEPRYDAFIRDVLLCGVPGLLMGILFVRIMKVPSFWVSPMEKSWYAEGRNTKKHHLKILFQMLVLKQIPLVYNTDYGAGQFYPQNILLITLNIILITLFYWTNRNDWPEHCAANIHRFHVSWAIFSAVLWGFAIYPVLDELYLLFVAMSLCLISLLVIWNLSRRDERFAHLFLGVSVAVARLNDEAFERWVQNGGSGRKQELELEQRGLPSMEEEFTREEFREALTALESEKEKPTISLASFHAKLRRVRAAGKVDPEAVEADDDGLLQGPYEGEGASRKGLAWRTLWSGLAIVGALAFIIWSGLQPLQWDGLMYRRHWCGVIIEEGGNGCLQMAAEDFKSG